MLGVAIIGCGLIGTRRAQAIGKGGRLVACADKDTARAEALADGKAEVFTNWREPLALPQVDAVIVATPHDSLAEITRQAIVDGKHVLVEKPAARNFLELEPTIEIARNSNVKVRVGFNHRYHRAFRKLSRLIAEDAIGELMFVRARYGHGGRLGYESEWRADPRLSGGGELIDQGSHLIDLSRWLFGSEFSEMQSFAHTYYWDMPVEDNAFLILKTIEKQVAFLHVSCTEWKNLFSMEIYGRNGKLEVAGLGGSYGVERLTWYRMLPEMGPPEKKSWDFPAEDDSWSFELSEFFTDIRENREPNPGLQDAYENLKIIHQVYEDAGFDNYS